MNASFAAALRSIRPFESRAMGPLLVAPVPLAVLGVPLAVESGGLRSCALTVVPSFLVYSFTWTVWPLVDDCFLVDAAAFVG